MFPISVNCSIKHSISWLWVLLSSSLFLTAFYMWHGFISPCRLVYILHGLGICSKCFYFSKYKCTFLLYVVATDSEPRCHSSGVLIFWCGISLAHVAQFSWGCRVDELAHLLVLSGYSLLMGFPQFACCVQVLQFICAQNPVEIPCEACVWRFI